MARQILITGGTSGIGAGIAAAFAAQGDQVTVTGATATEVETAAGRAGTTAQVLDVRDGAAYLLRPDQHVCARWLALDADRLQTALATALPA